MKARRPGPLHTRMTVVVASVLLAALSLTGVGTYLAFGAFLHERLDSALRDSPIVRVEEPENKSNDDAVGQDDAVVQDGGPRVEPFVQSIRADGTVLRTTAGRDASGHSFTAVLPSVLPDVARSDVPGGPAAFFDTRSREAAGPGLRVKVSRDLDGDVLILALPRTENDALLRRLAVLEVGVASTALLLTSGAAYWVVRRRLAPLRRLADEVDSVSADDLAVSVHVDGTSREVYELATATNVLLERMHEAFTMEQATQERLWQFIADASHELRTPIAAVSAYAQLFELGAKDRPADLARSMSGIQREAGRMRDLAEELLTLAAAEGSPAAETQAVDLAVVIGQAVEAALAVDPRWPVTTWLSPYLDSVAAEPAQLRRVLDNLLGNVRTHTPPGTSTRVEARQQGQEVAITVADDGPGLTAHERAHMFDRFWRKDASRSREAGGSGLGLAIVVTIVESWSGRVTASQNPGGGLIVTLALPTAPTSPALT